MNNSSKTWRIVQNQNGSVKIEVKQIKDQQSLINALVLTCLWLLTWPEDADILSELTKGNVLMLFGIGCLVAFPFAIAYIFYSEEWIVAHDSMTIRRSIFGFKRTIHYRRGHFEFVAREHESGHSWSLKICSPTGEQELCSPHSILELNSIAVFLSQQTGWPIQEYQGP